MRWSGRRFVVKQRILDSRMNICTDVTTDGVEFAAAMVWGTESLRNKVNNWSSKKMLWLNATTERSVINGSDSPIVIVRFAC